MMLCFTNSTTRRRWTRSSTTIYKLTHRNAQARLDRIRATINQNSDRNVIPLPPRTHLLAPLGVQRRLTPPADGIEIVTGRYSGFFPIGSIPAIQKKIVEIESHPDWPILLPSLGPQRCVFDPNEERNTLRKYLLAPYLPHRSIQSAQASCSATTSTPTIFPAPTPHPCHVLSCGYARAT